MLPHTIKAEKPPTIITFKSLYLWQKRYNQSGRQKLDRASKLRSIARNRVELAACYNESIFKYAGSVYGVRS